MTLRELLNFLSDPKNEAFYLNRIKIPMYLVVNPLMLKDEFFIYDDSFKKIWTGKIFKFVLNKSITPSYFVRKDNYDASIDIDLIESTQWQVLKKQISFEATFEEKGKIISSIDFDRFNDEAKFRIIEKYEELKAKHKMLCIEFRAKLRSSGHPREIEKEFLEEIYLTTACYDNILLEIEHAFQHYAEHKTLHMKTQTWTYR
ncbi:TPA: hypothetical protein SG801_001424 [Campylobacter coli]|nr:hypothetical protein [Campylobacter coli]